MITHEADMARHCRHIIRLKDGQVVGEEQE
jgi:ABC-type lipoprotein export system ATPase subunit